MDASLIICTLNRSASLIKCLDALLHSINQAMPFTVEIVVVDNGSSDDTPEKVAAWSARSSVPVRYLIENRRGAAKARNCGIRAAQGRLLVFLDDDCMATPNYMQVALDYNRGDTTPVLRSGRVELGDPTDLPITIILEPEMKRFRRSENTARHVNMGNTFLSCNMTMRKEIVGAIGFLDERLGAGTSIPGGEDIDFAFRAYLAGFTVEYVPDMTVHHFHGRKQWSEGAKLFRNYSLGGGALLAKYAFRHPNLVRQFSWDIKNIFREIITGTNRFMPQINFSYKKKVYYQLKGALMFLNVALIQRKKLVEQPAPAAP